MCHHEIPSGHGVTTIINARGIAGGCSICKTEALEAEVRALRLVAKVARVIVSNIASSEQLHIAGSDASALSRALDALPKETP